MVTRVCPALMVFILLVGVLPALAQQPVGDYVCGDATRVAWFRTNIGGAVMPPCEAPLTLHAIPTAQVQAQRLLHRTVPQRHLKVVGGLLAAMDPQEKAVAEAAYLERERVSLAFVAERYNQEICRSRSLEELSSKVAAVRTLVQSNVAAGQLGAALEQILDVVEKVARCDLAARRLD